MRMKNDLKTKQDKQVRKNRVIWWVSLLFILAISVAIGESIADVVTSQVFNINRGNLVNLKSVDEYDWKTYNIKDLIIDSPFILNANEFDYPEELNNIIVDDEHLEFEKDNFLFTINSATYNVGWELDLYGAYLGQINGIKSDMVVEEFQSKKREINIDGREGSKLIHYAEQVGALEKKKENGKNILYSKKKPSLKNIEFDDKKKNIEIENKKSDFKSNNSGCGMNVMFVIIILIVVFRLI